MKDRFWRGWSVLLLSTLACQPVIAIGGKELLFLVILTAILLGPPIYRFMRRMEEILRRRGTGK